MSWNYHKIEGGGSNDNLWSSYSDLFMMMSIVFLLLYVVSSLRNGTESIKNQLEYQQMLLEAQDYREQNRVYNALKNDYLEKEATQQEQAMYEELMSKLELLEDEAEVEKNRLRKLASENEQKEQAINRYQQMVRNIINANMLAKSNLQAKDLVINQNRENLKQAKAEIRDKDKEIKVRDQRINRYSATIAQNKQQLQKREKQVAEMRMEIEDKKTSLAKTRAQIVQARSRLDKQIEQLKQREQDKAKLAQKIDALKKRTSAKIQNLSQAKSQLESTLDNASKELTGLKSELKQASATIAMSEKEKEKLLTDLEQSKQAYQSEIGNLQNEFKKQLADEKKALGDQLKSARASAAEKEAAKQAYKAKAEALGDKFKSEVGALKDKIAQAEASIAKNDAEKEGYKKFIDDLKAEKADLAQIAKESKAKEQARKKLANRLKNALARAGVDAEVDPNTGDVILSFGNDYFETDSSRLKPSMKRTLKKFVPIYAKKLFEDPKIAKLVESVEIIGFASPTYRGKLVDPQSLSAGDRDAVNYNLDLSYQRAKSIFEHIFDVNEMRYSNQKRLLSLVNVSGRSYLSEDVKGTQLDKSLSRKEFCDKYNCKKQQRVIIKFDLKDR